MLRFVSTGAVGEVEDTGAVAVAGSIRLGALAREELDPLAAAPIFGNGGTMGGVRFGAAGAAESAVLGRGAADCATDAAADDRVSTLAQ